VRRVIGKKDDDAESEGEQPGVSASNKNKGTTNISVTQNIKLDLEIIKGMTVEELKKARLF
jgi:hypothetical protein